jgi:hypothetical protein
MAAIMSGFNDGGQVIFHWFKLSVSALLNNTLSLETFSLLYM